MFPPAIIREDDREGRLFYWRFWQQSQCGEEGSVRTPQQFSSTSWVSYSSIQFWHYLSPHTSLTASPGGHLCFWLPGSRQKVPMTASSGLIHLLEWLVDLRETFYLTAGWKRYIARGVGQRWGASSLSSHQPLSPNRPIWKLSKLSFWHFMEASLQRHNRLNHWLLAIEPNLQLLSLPGSSRDGTEGSNLLITTLAPVATRLHPLVTYWLSKSHLHRTKTPLLLSSLRKFQGFSELCAKKQGQRPHIYLF